jgi:hypothetical protein
MIKPVKSNPKGFGIHSPFAFNLVNRVIFAGYGKSGWLSGWPWTRRKQNGDIRELLNRLLEYFSPERILVYNAESDPDRFFSGKLSGNAKLLYVRSGESVKILPGDFIFLQEGEMTGLVTHNVKHDLVMFLADIRSTSGREYFKKLGSDDNVSQTYELNNCGIAIFNPKFQKENFVIKGKISY